MIVYDIAPQKGGVRRAFFLMSLIAGNADAGSLTE